MKNFSGEFQQDILDKLYAFCAYQERCKQDIEKKLAKLQIDNHYHDLYIKHLEDEKFLNEERYVQFYVRGKLKGNKWGKKKIRFMLTQKNIPNSLIEQAFSSLDDANYQEIALALAEKKNRSIKEENEWKRKQKLYAYLAQKGFEHYVISQAIEEILD